MICSVCGRSASPHEVACADCGTALQNDQVTQMAAWTAESAEAATVGPVPMENGRRAATGPAAAPSPAQAARATGGAAAPLPGPLQIGPFGSRYHVIRLLGMGGMGAVYQAWDEELGVAVALKVIRPDLGQSEQVEQRFKRELLLARQVTHKHVVRIHDLGEIDGIKYITMPYVQGANLETVLKREGRLQVARALRIAKQVASGLAAAHEAGIVHRDLKPANIMIDADENALIMDFGISTSAAAPASIAGGVVGTLAYMAPEQAMAQAVDCRADIYAFGMIVHDMLSGGRAGAAGQSAVAELMARIHNAPPPIESLNPQVTATFAGIVARCVLPAAADRFQRTPDLVAALESLDADGNPVDGTRTAWSSASRSSAAPRRRRVLQLTAAGAVLAFLAVATTVVGPKVFPRGDSAGTATPKIKSLAVFPFRNSSGNASLNWLGETLAGIIETEIGDGSTLRVVASDRLAQILRDLRISADNALDPATLRRLSEFSKADVLVSGQFARFGDTVRIDVTLQTADGGAPILLNAEAANEGDIPRAMKTLVSSVRDRLALATTNAAAGQRALAAATSQSMPALRAYTEGLGLARQGNNLAALRQFKAATEADPNFALAFARLAVVYHAVGSDRDAEQAGRRAIELADKLPPEHRYLVDAIRAQTANDSEKAIDAYERLIKIAPNDSQVLFAAGGLYENTGAFDKASAAFKRVLELDPNYSDALYAMGRVEIRRKNPQAALEYLTRALNLAIQTDNREAEGDMRNAIGIAYKRMNKPDDALRYYREALDIRRQLDYKRGVAATLSEMGQVQSDLQQIDASEKSFNEALAIRRSIDDKRGVGNTLIDLGSLYTRLGRTDAALALFKESLQIQLDTGNANYQGLLLHNIGAIHLRETRLDDALTYFHRALDIREKLKVPVDIAETLHGLAETEAKVGQLDDSLSHFLRALELRRSGNDKRGAATESFGMAIVFTYQGRYGAAVDAQTEALATFRTLPDKPWLASILIAEAETLAEMGRGDPARAAADEGLKIARELESSRLQAMALNARGASYLYAGDLKLARGAFEQAIQSAGRNAGPDLDLEARLNLMKVDVEEGRATAAKLQQAIDRANALRLRPLALEGTVYAARAALASRDAATARRSLESALDMAEKLGIRPVAVQAHYLLATVLRDAGDTAGGSKHLAEARAIVDAIHKDARSDDVLARRDFRLVVSQPSPSS